MTFFCHSDLILPMNERETCLLNNGRISECFRKISERPLTPPPLFRKIILRFFPQTDCAGTKFAMKFFGSEMTPPPFRKFSGNSSILVETGFPKCLAIMIIIVVTRCICHVFSDILMTQGKDKLGQLSWAIDCI